MILSDTRPEIVQPSSLMLKIGEFNQASPRDINLLLHRVKELASEQDVDTGLIEE